MKANGNFGFSDQNPLTTNCCPRGSCGALMQTLENYTHSVARYGERDITFGKETSIVPRTYGS